MSLGDHEMHSKPPEEKDSAELESLMQQVKEQKKQRASALAKLKASVECSTSNSTADKPCDKSTKSCEPLEKVNGHADEMRKARSSGLDVLKKTTNRAIESLRETIFIDKEELKKRLKAD